MSEEKTMDDRGKLRDQILRLRDEVRQAAKVQWADYGRLQNKIQTLKVLDIILTAVSSVGIISFFFHGNLQINAVTSLVTLASLSLNLYTSNFRDDENKTLHADAAAELWAVEKGYESLLTDFDSLSSEDARAKRDTLMGEVDRINREYFCLNRVTHGKLHGKKQRVHTLPPEAINRN